ncbi:MAG: matrixin family metalloprotease [Planctomycetota bacterium]
MKSSIRVLATALIAGCTAGLHAEPLAQPEAPQGVSARSHDRAVRLIQMQTFYSLPAEHRAEIIATAEAEGIELPMTSDDLEHESDPRFVERNEPLAEGELEELYAVVQHAVARQDFERFQPIHQRMLVSFAEVIETHKVPVQPCFTPGTDPALVMAFENVVFPAGASRFQQTNRWQGTALNPGGAQQGDPTILTYSFPDDGVTIPNGVGEGPGPNDLNSFMDGIYGTRATWRAIYDEVFELWGDLSGNTYILEPNDDNVTFFDNPGVAGVRGDLRMGGKFIDGNSNTLAYNFFPQNGDMVLDTGDNFYFNTNNSSLRLRNILAHEHGHGMGQLHVCPITQSILMEPFISLAYDGPQHDDTLNAQRHYGDFLEPNDTVGTATILGSGGVFSAFTAGTLGNNSANRGFVSIDDNSDTDYYEFTATEDVSLNITLTPVGFTYTEGPQTQACNTGSSFNSAAQGNLQVDVFNSSGSSIGFSNDAGLGAIESLTLNVSPGTYQIRVRNSGENSIQAYQLNATLLAPVALPLQLNFLTPLPGTIEPAATSVPIFVQLLLNGDTLLEGPDLNIRRAGETNFTAIPLAETTPGTFQFTLSDFDCGDDPEVFISARGIQAGDITLPSGDPEQVLIGSATVTADSGEGSIGWTIGGDITLQSFGRWTNAVPQGNDRADPPADADGSGPAWLTGQEQGNDNTDVDEGSTILTSPVFDFSGGGTIRFSYWSNDEINTVNEATDGLDVEVSINGGTSWTTVRDYDTATVWRDDTLLAGVDFALSDQVRFRFIATEAGQGDVLECGVDDIRVTTLTCTDPDPDPVCPGDVNRDGEVNDSDFFAWVTAFTNNAPECDVNEDGNCSDSDFFAWVTIFTNGGC